MWVRTPFPLPFASCAARNRDCCAHNKRSTIDEGGIRYKECVWQMRETLAEPLCFATSKRRRRELSFRARDHCSPRWGENGVTCVRTWKELAAYLPKQAQRLRRASGSGKSRSETLVWVSTEPLQSESKRKKRRLSHCWLLVRRLLETNYRSLVSNAVYPKRTEVDECPVQRARRVWHARHIKPQHRVCSEHLCQRQIVVVGLLSDGMRSWSWEAAVAYQTGDWHAICSGSQRCPHIRVRLVGRDEDNQLGDAFRTLTPTWQMLQWLSSIREIHQKNYWSAHSPDGATPNSPFWCKAQRDSGACRLHLEWALKGSAPLPLDTCWGCPSCSFQQNVLAALQAC